MGAPTISSEQFATILLRHTQHDVQNVVQRLHSRPVPPTEVYVVYIYFGVIPLLVLIAPMFAFWWIFAWCF